MGVASDFDRSNLTPEIADLMERVRQRRVEAGLAVRVSDRPEHGVSFLNNQETVDRWRKSVAKRGATIEVVRE